MKKRISISKDILEVINQHVEECLKYKERDEQNERFSQMDHPHLKPIKMTPVTAVFLYDNKSKIVIKRVIFREESPTQEDVISLAAEHENVMKTFTAFKSLYQYNEWDDYLKKEVKQSKVIIWLFCEYLPIRISQREINKDERKIKKIAKDVLLGLSYLHSKNVAHLDIKIANIMGTYKEGQLVYKLIDMGYARDFDKDLGAARGETYIPKKSFGTFPYKPPEVVKENIHALKSDIYCLGAVVWFLSIGYIPFYNDGEKDIDLFRKFVSGKVKFKFKEKASDLLKDFVIKAMERDRNKRPSADELLNHPFLE